MSTRPTRYHSLLHTIHSAGAVQLRRLLGILWILADKTLGNAPVEMHALYWTSYYLQSSCYIGKWTAQGQVGKISTERSRRCCRIDSLDGRSAHLSRNLIDAMPMMVM
jgi:hypothetical protein